MGGCAFGGACGLKWPRLSLLQNLSTCWLVVVGESSDLSVADDVAVHIACQLRERRCARTGIALVQTFDLHEYVEVSALRRRARGARGPWHSSSTNHARKDSTWCSVHQNGS
jgi:hypothetical protein